LLLLAAPLRADVCVWRDPERTMQRLFPAARDYKTVAVKITPERIAALERALGARLDDSEKTEFSFYDITGGSDKPRPIGSVLALAGKGQYGAIEVVIGLDADARIVGAYIQRSRERATKALQSPQFLKQFVGKTKSDAFQVGKDLDAASPEAEAASRVVAGVVKKMLVFNDVLRVGGSR
jgi:hypothetical protein